MPKPSAFYPDASELLDPAFDMEADEPRCPDCGALVDDDGYSIDERCCFYCRAD